MYSCSLSFGNTAVISPAMVICLADNLLYKSLKGFGGFFHVVAGCPLTTGTVYLVIQMEHPNILAIPVLILSHECLCSCLVHFPVS